MKQDKDFFTNKGIQNHWVKPVVIVLLIAVGIACARSDQVLVNVNWKTVEPWVGQGPTPQPTPLPSATPHPLMTLFPPTTGAGEIYPQPTNDPIRVRDPLATPPAYYVVQWGESLNQIAGRVGVGSSQIMVANGIPNPNYLAVGQVLSIPTPFPQAPGPTLKLIPDSELVFGPSTIFFDLYAVIQSWDGYLVHYTEEVEGQIRTGPEIVEMVAKRHSVNPKLLLAVLEYQSGWLTKQGIDSAGLIYPMRLERYGYEGLYRQLFLAADYLNQGFYLWQAGWAGPYVFSDGSVVLPGEGINAGTVGVQNLFSQLYTVDTWRSVVNENGFIQVYTLLFGNPFEWAIEPLFPVDLRQPELQLPFEPDRSWSFTGGPHSAWGNWSGWAALDFAPPGDALGCVLSNEWVVASAAGLVARSEYGRVLQDLDGDGFEQTGWVLLYLHLETRDRVGAGSDLEAGDPIGHPSCEGGVSTGTHLHLARKYNGVWISADGPMPFVMDGWTSYGSEWPYDGSMVRGDIVLEACSCRSSSNQIWR